MKKEITSRLKGGGEVIWTGLGWQNIDDCTEKYENNQKHRFVNVGRKKQYMSNHIRLRFRSSGFGVVSPKTTEVINALRDDFLNKKFFIERSFRRTIYKTAEIRVELLTKKCLSYNFIQEK